MLFAYGETRGWGPGVCSASRMGYPSEKLAGDSRRAQKFADGRSLDSFDEFDNRAIGTHKPIRTSFRVFKDASDVFWDG